MSARVKHNGGSGDQYEGIFACPHCGHENRKWFGLWNFRPETVICDDETGGCDTYFAVTAAVEITVTPTVRKIEGCELTAEQRRILQEWREGGCASEDVGGAS